MARFVRTLFWGTVIGAGIAVFLMPESRRQKLFELADDLISGRRQPDEVIREYVEAQRARLERAVEVARQVAEARERELWAELKLPQPDRRDGERA